jgi:hypothetical protein
LGPGGVGAADLGIAVGSGGDAGGPAAAGRSPARDPNPFGDIVDPMVLTKGSMPWAVVDEGHGAPRIGR